MKSQARHGSEDRLLELAYGELPEPEARALQAHLEDCPRCTESLRQMRSVRTTMAPLAQEPVPDAGLDSLLAYAKSAAQRNAQERVPARRGWRRFVAPAAGLAAASLFGVVVLREHAALDVAQPEIVQQQREDKAALEQYGASAPPPPAPMASRGEASRDVGVGGLGSRSRPSAIPPSKRALPERKDEAKEQLPGFADNGVLSEGRGSAQAEPEEAREREAPTEEGASEALAERTSAPSAPAARMKKAQPAPASVTGASEQSASVPASPPTPAAAKAGPPAQQQARAETQGAADEKSAAGANRAADAAPLARGTQTARAPGDPVALAREAQAARASGDRVQEALLLREALAAGARDRAGLLRRLCEAELASGRRAEAREACEAVRSEAPGTSEARAAQRLLEQLGAPSAPAQ